MRARVSALAASGNASSISSIFVTGLKTCSAAKRSARPLTAASALTDSDEVVVASTAPGASTRGELAEQRRLRVLVLDDRLDHEGDLGEAPLLAGHLDRVGVEEACARRRADPGERAHRITGPWRAATAARPRAIVPLPTIPSRSGSWCLSVG